MFAAVTNTRSYGGGFLVSPAARVDDGALDLCIVRRTGRARLLWHFPRILRARTAVPEVIHAASPWVRIEADDGELPVTLDGELPQRQATPVELRCEPAHCRCSPRLPGATRGRHTMRGVSHEWPDIDVVIVGAGVGGAALALALASAYPLRRAAGRAPLRAGQYQPRRQPAAGDHRAPRRVGGAAAASRRGRAHGRRDAGLPPPRRACSWRRRWRLARRGPPVSGPAAPGDRARAVDTARGHGPGRGALSTAGPRG